MLNEQLLKDMEVWMEEESKRQIISKARRVYYKCLLRKKKELSDRIYQKYQLAKHEYKSDLAVAMGFALMANTLINK